MNPISTIIRHSMTRCFPAAAQVPFYLDLARQGSDDVLELACGTGQLTLPIARAGFSAVGLDLSSPMLTAARERAAAANVPVDFRLGDMRNFDLGRKFALIFIARSHRSGGTWRLGGRSRSTSLIQT